MGDPAGFVVSGALAERIARLAGDYVALARTHTGQLPVTDYDADWPSACVGDMIDANRCHWQPVAMERALSFERRTGFTFSVRLNSSYQLPRSLPAE